MFGHDTELKSTDEVDPANWLPDGFFITARAKRVHAKVVSLACFTVKEEDCGIHDTSFMKRGGDSCKDMYTNDGTS